MNITIHGAGYVGLVTAACLADVGHRVICHDIDAARIDRLRNGKVPIYEPGLEDILARCVAGGNLRFTTDVGEAVRFGELLFIAVGTPQDDDGSADLSHVLSVAKAIGEHMQDRKIIVDKSTVPVGTAERVRDEVAAALNGRGVAIPFDVCSNPEFLKEGAAIDDFTKAPRIVVGTDSEHVRERMRACYAPYNRNHEKIMFMDVRAAELTKYAANAMLALKISYINEIANIAERLGVDIEQVRRGIGSDPRIGYQFIYPGAGYGGSCFPKDVQALIRSSRDAGHESHLLAAVEAINEGQKTSLFRKLDRALGGALATKTIAVWGLSFKPNTDDMRNAPSRTLIEAVWTAGAKVQAYDPEAMDEAKRIYGDRPDLVLVDHPLSALKGADALVICTEWTQFRAVDLANIATELKHKLVVDGRNLYDPAEATRAGLRYFAVGRGDSIDSSAQLPRAHYNGSGAILVTTVHG